MRTTDAREVQAVADDDVVDEHDVDDATSCCQPAGHRDVSSGCLDTAAGMVVNGQGIGRTDGQGVAEEGPRPGIAAVHVPGRDEPRLGNESLVRIQREAEQLLMGEGNQVRGHQCHHLLGSAAGGPGPSLRASDPTGQLERSSHLGGMDRRLAIHDQALDIPGGQAEEPGAEEIASAVESTLRVGSRADEDRDELIVAERADSERPGPVG